MIDYYDSPDGYDFSSELVRNDNTFKRVQITNTSDRFELIASYASKTYPNMTVLSVLRKSYRQSFGNIMADSFSDLEKCAAYEGISPDNEYWDIDEYLYIISSSHKTVRSSAPKEVRHRKGEQK